MKVAQASFHSYPIFQHWPTQLVDVNVDTYIEILANVVDPRAKIRFGTLNRLLYRCLRNPAAWQHNMRLEVTAKGNGQSVHFLFTF
jgi:hypothetical protein